ncbi:MAG: methyltransferase domain-containing protein [Polyangiaceae bacterium]
MTMLSFDSRLDQDELMDVEKVSFEEFRDCLVDLTRVNELTLAYRPTLAYFERLLPQIRALGRPLEVVDVGSGYGDMLRAIHGWARTRDVAISLTGVDMNPWSAKAAREATLPLEGPIEWVTADAFAYDPPRGIDVVVSSLFTHHLRDHEVVRFLRWMETTATTGWFVNDLHRHPIPYYFFRTFAKLARYHRFVQHDGPVSIARAFSPADWRRLAREADIDLNRVTIAWRVPFRLTVERVKG